jgi:hypothetical protein
MLQHAGTQLDHLVLQLLVLCQADEDRVERHLRHAQQESGLRLEKRSVLLVVGAPRRPFLRDVSGLLRAQLRRAPAHRESLGAGAGECNSSSSSSGGLGLGLGLGAARIQVDDRVLLLLAPNALVCAPRRLCQRCLSSGSAVLRLRRRLRRRRSRRLGRPGSRSGRRSRRRGRRLRLRLERRRRREPVASRAHVDVREIREKGLGLRRRWRRRRRLRRRRRR